MVSHIEVCVYDEHHVRRSVLQGPVGVWVLAFDAEGLWGLSLQSPGESPKSAARSALPDWLKQGWDAFWGGMPCCIPLRLSKRLSPFTERVYDEVLRIPEVNA